MTSRVKSAGLSGLNLSPCFVAVIHIQCKIWLLITNTREALLLCRNLIASYIIMIIIIIIIILFYECMFQGPIGFTYSHFLLCSIMFGGCFHVGECDVVSPGPTSSIGWMVSCRAARSETTALWHPSSSQHWLHVGPLGLTLSQRWPDEVLLDNIHQPLLWLAQCY